MAELDFYPIDVVYKVEKRQDAAGASGEAAAENAPVIELYGRGITENQQLEQMKVRYWDFAPYFWVIPSGDAEEAEAHLQQMKADSPEHRVTATEVHTKNYLGKEVKAVKVMLNVPAAVPSLREKAREFGLVLEADIPFTKRFLIDKRVMPLALYKADATIAAAAEEEKNRGLPSYSAEKLSQISEEMPNLSILAIDIETHNPLGKTMLPEEHPIIMAALCGESGFRKVLTWKKFPTQLEYIEFVNSEIELLERLKHYIGQYEPDIITGYFSDVFDLPYIKSRADRYRIKFDIGLDGSQPKTSKTSANTTTEITGIVHLDVFKFIRKVMWSSLQTTVYDLSSVAKELLNETKEAVDIDKLYIAWDNHEGSELESYCSYNMQDAQLTLNLCKKVLPNVMELTRTIGLPLYDVSRMSYSQLVEWYLIKQAREFNELAPNRPGSQEESKRRMISYTGGFVYEPTPGLYKDIAVFDFMSLYPTIISAHNVSPDTLNCSCCINSTQNRVPEEENIWFCTKRRGFIPTVIDEVIKRRIRVKEIIKVAGDDKTLNARQMALKTIANSMYGYFGFYGARWYSIECAKAITAFGRNHIQTVIEKAKSEGFKVLYSDSLPYERHIFVKFRNGNIKPMPIGKLYENHRKDKGLSTIALTANGKVAFKPIKKVIMHSYKGKLLQIITKYGSTTVTPAHSVYALDSKGQICLADAKELRKGDKLISLTNLPVIENHKKGHVFDVAELDLGEYWQDLLLYLDNKQFQNKRGKCPYCKKNVILSGHVFSKHRERRMSLSEESSFKWVGGKNAKARKIPRHWRLDENLAWLLGYYCAEGSVSDVHTKTGRKVLLSFGSQDLKLIRKTKAILEEKTQTKTRIIKDYDKRIGKTMFYYRAQSIPIVPLFSNGFGAGKGSEHKKLPWFIYTAEESLRRAFLKGYLDGDGNTAKDERYATHFIRFSTKSKELAIGLAFLLKSLKHGITAKGKRIRHVAWQYREDKPKICSLRLQSAKEDYGNFCAAEIREIKEVSGENQVYDIEVQDAHNFVDAEGMILVHNTDSIFLSLDGKTKEDIQGFVAKVNKNLPGMMELDYEGFYPAGIFVGTKGTGQGAKKKYALISEDGRMKIRGFETVRRNLSKIAKETQERVLDIILRENDLAAAVEHVKGVIHQIRSKKTPVEKIVITTQLQKEIKSYESYGPHVAAAQRMKEQNIPVGPGSIIRYVVIRGSDRIRDRVRLPEEVKEGEYDPEYYVNNQVVPAVEKILEIFGCSGEELAAEKTQQKLQAWFG